MKLVPRTEDERRAGLARIACDLKNSETNNLSLFSRLKNFLFRRSRVQVVSSYINSYYFSCEEEPLK